MRGIFKRWLLWVGMASVPLARRVTAIKLILIVIALLAGWGCAFQLWRYPARLRSVLEPGDYHLSGFSDDGERFLATERRDERSHFRIWDVRTGRALFSLEDSPTEIENLTISPDAKILARWNFDDGLKVWDVARGTARILIKNTDGLSRPELQFSPDSRLLAVSFPLPTYQIRVLDAEAGDEIATFDEALGVFAFAANSQTLAWVSSDSKLGNITLRLWNRESNHVNSRVVDREVQTLSLSPDGKVLAAASNAKGMQQTSVMLWKTETLDLVASFALDKDWWSIDRIFFSPDSRLLVVDGTMATKISSIIYDMRFMPPKELAQFEACPLFARDGETFAILPDKDLVELWDSTTMQKCSSFRCRRDPSASFCSWYHSPDGRLAALNCADRSRDLGLVDWIGQHGTLGSRLRQRIGACLGREGKSRISRVSRLRQYLVLRER